MKRNRMIGNRRKGSDEREMVKGDDNGIGDERRNRI